MDITVYNRSDELVGPFLLRIYSRRTEELHNTLGMIDQVPVLPGGQRTVHFSVRQPADSAALGPELEFRDSSGRWWRRRASDPIEEIDGPSAGGIAVG
jgi:hypothetical protein